MGTSRMASAIRHLPSSARAGAGDLGGLAGEIAVQVVGVAEILILDQPVGVVDTFSQRISAQASL